MLRGASPRTWTRPDWSLLASVYALAFFLRMTLWRVPMYGDEGHMYMASRNLGRDPSNILRLMESQPIPELAPLFWYRPFSHLPMTPGALVSFDGWRFLHIVYTAFLPLLVVLILRDLGVRKSLAYVAGLAVAFHPIILVHGVLVFHDELGATAFLAGLWGYIRGRPRLSAAFMVASVWVEEITLFGITFLLAADVYQGLRNRTTRLFPLQLTKFQTLYLFVLVLGPLPFLYSLFIGGRFPGHEGEADIRLLFDRVFFLAWFLPLIIAGLFWERTRRICLLGLVYPGFYLFYAFIGRKVEVWWMIMPASLAVIAAAFALDHAWTHWPLPRLRNLAGSRRAMWGAVPRAVACVLLAFLFLQLFVSSENADRNQLTMPVSRHGEMSVGQMIDFQMHRDLELVEMLRQLTPDQLHTVFLIDSGWFYKYYPFSQIADTVRYAYTGEGWPDYHRHRLEVWVEVLEVEATVTVLTISPDALNVAIQNVYADCVLYENAVYKIMDARDCAGRADQLEAEYAGIRGF